MFVLKVFTFAISLLVIGLSNDLIYGDTIVRFEHNRDSLKREWLILNTDGQSCRRVSDYSDDNKAEYSEACKALQIGRELESQLGQCKQKRLDLVKDERAGHFEDLFLSDSQGMEVWNGSTLQRSKVEQGCVCVKRVATVSHFNFFKNLNPIGLVDGPYFSKKAWAVTASAQECIKLFDTPTEKEIVRKLYQKYGLN